MARTCVRSRVQQCRLTSPETHHKPPRNAKAPTPRQKGEGSYLACAQGCACVQQVLVICEHLTATIANPLLAHDVCKIDRRVRVLMTCNAWCIFHLCISSLCLVVTTEITHRVSQSVTWINLNGKTAKPLGGRSRLDAQLSCSAAMHPLHSPANRVATRDYRRIRRRKKINPVGNVGTGPDAHFCKKDNFLRVLENTNFPPIFWFFESLIP